MKFTLVLATAAVASGFGIEKDADYAQFQEFVETYGKTYNNQAEVEGRFNIFKQNLALIKERNSDGGKDVHAVNKFADIHPDEFKKMYHGARLSGVDDPSLVKQFNTTAKPANIDWRLKGAVTAVKNQGQCGSCWAFSTTEQIESDTFLATGVLNTLAPQQIVSCDTVDDGCNGGNPINAYSYVKGAGGVEFLKNYPYTSGTTQTAGACDFDKADVAKNTKPTGYNIISQSASQEVNMYSQIQESPMSVCVDATLWQTYSSGIITAADNCGTSIDHAVQAVGIGGADTDTPYWIVRNSWAADWGEDGYVYVATGSNNCGITAEATITDPN
eukprot:CAMPEP_0195507252 /NCGR_PEP_ID=MMETSP0794_2-20130614/734_1 /TAXON_ID=515487 /ORGANISM="Stephanopyxis turris, Strain CCMP 815" /LENGTH=329 /DNA_ID=CAMNT_0040633871 /DNA_START=91 /DNA_END=1080 /DNA_ORIENTATION=-